MNATVFICGGHSQALTRQTCRCDLDSVDADALASGALYETLLWILYGKSVSHQANSNLPISGAVTPLSKAVIPKQVGEYQGIQAQARRKMRRRKHR